MKLTKKNFQQLITLDGIFIAFVTIFFLVMLVETFSIIEITQISAVRLPRLLCIAGFILSVMILISKLLKNPAENEQEIRTGDNITNKKQQGTKLLYAVLFTIAYFLLIPLLGFILTTILVTVAFSFFMGYKKKVIVVAVAILTTLFLQLSFGTLLDVSLPQGIIIKSLLSF